MFQETFPGIFTLEFQKPLDRLSVLRTLTLYIIIVLHERFFFYQPMVEIQANSYLYPSSPYSILDMLIKVRKGRAKWMLT